MRITISSAEFEKNRLAPLLPLVLSSHQKCSYGKINIFEATGTIFDKIGEMRHKRKNGLFVSFDLDHAFDRVNKGFLLSTLENMNFNPNFVQLVKRVMEASFSRVMVNGHLSTEFQILRSVR